MASSLRTLSKQVRRKYGKLLITTFNTAYEPGSIIRAKSWSDINLLGQLGNSFPEDELPDVYGPNTLEFGNFQRQSEVDIGAAIDIIQPNASGRTRLKKARHATANFESLLATSFDLFELSDAMRADGSFWSTTLGETMLENKVRVCYQVIKGRITFMFHGSGEVALEMKTILGNLNQVGVGANWRWQNRFVLESKKDVTIAVETARWLKSKRRLAPMKAKV